MHVGDHFLRLFIDQSYISGNFSISRKEVANIQMSCPVFWAPSFLDYLDYSFIILVDHCGWEVITLCYQHFSHPQSIGESIVT